MKASDHLTDSPKYLVVEDSEDQLFVWKQLFRRAGLHARFCLTARAALTHLEEGYVPDVLMSDFYLPDMTGIDVIYAVRAVAGPIPCLLVTGNRDDDALTDRITRDDISIAYKPIKFDELEKKLRELGSSVPRKDRFDGAAEKLEIQMIDLVGRIPEKFNVGH